jgi:hypothetical protein
MPRGPAHIPVRPRPTPRNVCCSGPDGSGTVYLTSSFMDTSRPVPTPVNYVEALDVQTGAVRWANSTARPPTSGTPTSDTAALHGVTPLPGAAVYAQGQRLYGLSEATGEQLWSVVVATGAAFGGTTANVSSVTYVEPSPPDARTGVPYPQLLLQSVTFQQTRFVAYRFNGSVEAAPTAAWQNRGNQDFEGTLEDPLTRLGLQLPTVSQLAGAFVFWSNRTSERAAACIWGLCSVEGGLPGRSRLLPGGPGRPATRPCSAGSQHRSRGDTAPVPASTLRVIHASALRLPLARSLRCRQRRPARVQHLARGSVCGHRQRGVGAQHGRFRLEPAAGVAPNGAPERGGGGDGGTGGAAGCGQRADAVPVRCRWVGGGECVCAWGGGRGGGPLEAQRGRTMDSKQRRVKPGR